MAVRRFCDWCDDKIADIADYYILNIEKRGSYTNSELPNYKNVEVCKDCFSKMEMFVKQRKSKNIPMER